jgi:hypothetical protein
MDDDEWQSRWEGSGDREKVVASLIIGAFFLGVGACVLFSRLDMGASLANPAPWIPILGGLGFLLRAVYIVMKPRIPVKYRKLRIPVKYRKRPIQADPEQRARQAEIRRLRQEGLLVSQPDLARELGVQSPTVRRWCQMLGIEPAYQLGRNYYTLEQADLIRRYGMAGITQRREILEEALFPEVEDLPREQQKELREQRRTEQRQRAIVVRKARSRKEPKIVGRSDILVTLAFGIVWVGLIALVTRGVLAAFALLALPGVAAVAWRLWKLRTAAIHRNVLLRSMKETVGTLEGKRKKEHRGDYKEERYYTYHVTVRFEAEDAKLGTREMVLKAEVSSGIWRGLRVGQWVRIRYAAEDPRIALFQWEW